MDIVLYRSVDYWLIGLIIALVIFFLWNVRALIKYKKTILLVVFRVLIIGTCILLLFHPKLLFRKGSTTPQTWHLYIDNSASMRYHTNTSLSSLNMWIGELIDEFENKNIAFETFHFSSEVVNVDDKYNITATGSLTDLGKINDHINNNAESLAGVIIISDGQITTGEVVQRKRRNFDIPIYIIGIGDTSKMVDVAITTVDVPSFSIRGEPVSVEATIGSKGIKSKRFSVSLFDGNELIGSRNVRIEPSALNNSVYFQFVPKSIGTNTYRIQVSSLTDELNISNNHYLFTLSVLKERYKVALVTGVPNFNTSILKKAVRGIKRFQLDHFVQFEQAFKPPFKQFWTTHYDLIIFDNFPTKPLGSQWSRLLRDKLLAQQSAKAWFYGPNISNEAANTFAKFFEIKNLFQFLDSYQKQSWTFTDEVEKRLDINVKFNDLSKFPPLKLGLQLGSMEDNFFKLAIVPPPIDILVWVLTDNVVRTSIWTTPDLYQIQYQQMGYQERGLLNSLLINTFEWLVGMSGHDNMHFKLDKNSYNQGERINITGNYADQSSTTANVQIKILKGIILIKNADLIYNQEDKRWEGSIGAPAAGQYNYEVIYKDNFNKNIQIGDFLVQESQIELNDVRLNEIILSNFIMTADDRFLKWSSRSALYEKIAPVEDQKFREVEIDLSRKWFIMVLIIGLLTIEWFYRRKTGLS